MQDSASHVARRQPIGAPPWRERRVTLGGAAVDLLDRVETLAVVENRLQGPLTAPLVVASANLDHLHHFGTGGRWFAKLPVEDEQADWLVLLDGMPLVWRAERLTGMKLERLAGADLLPAMLDLAQELHIKVGFLGGTGEMHEQLDRAVRQGWPSLAACSYWAPARHEIQDPGACARLVSHVREAGVHLLVVGLGKPRQELWIADHGVHCGAHVLLAFGASADFVAGKVRRAPEWIRDYGLEWCYRLALEPRRMSRRYLVQGPRSLRQLARDSRRDPAVLTKVPRQRDPLS